MDKIVIFGAGRIGRSFIGQVFGRSGYEVVFVDIDPSVIGALNEKRRYEVIIKTDGEYTLAVENVRGVLCTDEERVAAEIADARLAAVSVGKNALRGVLPVLARGLVSRRQKHPGRPLDIIIAENMRDADGFIRENLAASLPADYPLDELVGLVETSIGKMVPIVPAGDDPLSVAAEAYNSLIVDGRGFLGPVPEVADLAPKENIKAWVDRKLFIHNMGHAAAAYLGNRYMPGARLMCEVLEDARVEQGARGAMAQSAAALMALHPGEFTPRALEAHIDDLITRFRNPRLGDTVHRVGCDLPRKLRVDDRLCVPIRTAVAFGLPYDKILDAFAAGMRFDATAPAGSPHPGDAEYLRSLAENGVKQTLIRISMLDPTHDAQFMEKAESRYRQGIMSMGTWLVDIVKFIDEFPQKGNLTTIRSIATGGGGCSHNVMIDLAKLQTGLPLYAGGLVGDDDHGRYLLGELGKNGIDARHMTVTDRAATSYTDVMTEARGGARTFFHYRGACALLGPEHFEAVQVPAKIFHLGYLLLLDRMDGPDPEYGCRAARVLAGLRAKGYKTSVDVVSEQGNRFREVVTPSLKYIDYLIINEIEAGACCDMELRDPGGNILLENVAAAAARLLETGVNDTVVIHFPEGGYGHRRTGEKHYEPTLMLAPDKVLSSVGAGDAFCAGMLYALHGELPLRDGLIFANTCARFNLTDATCTGGAPAIGQVQRFIEDNYQR